MIQHLIEEHRKIQSLLNILKTQTYLVEDSNVHNALALKEIMHVIKILARDLHHHKEEAILFPLLDELPQLKNGGPKCTLFYGIKMEKNFDAKIKKALLEEPDVIAPPAWIDITKSLHDKNSPLKIPLDEHDYGYYYVNLISKEIQRYGEDPLRTHPLIVLLLQFVDLMEFHIKKEDECLYQVALTALSSEVLCEMRGQALTLDQSKAKELELVDLVMAKYSN
ncbi:MAG: hypothetical protein HOO06_05270 [Bdellovibrionaceae bacterium]|jgi:hemerythrin-like domain-containing protein|nr:hypothetical protein [Pseudobdellovibrionaceae bacterium]